MKYIFALFFILGALFFSPSAFAQSAGYACCLAGIESSGDPTVCTPIGTYCGLYQLSPSAAEMGGACGAGSGTTWATCNFSNGKYCPSICSYSQFFANTPAAIAAQNAALTAYTNDNWATIARLNPNAAALLDSGGTLNINGVTVTKDTLLAIAHNQGPGAALDFLTGTYTGTDGNGATAQGYGGCINKCLSGDTSKCDLTATSGDQACGIQAPTTPSGAPTTPTTP